MILPLWMDIFTLKIIKMRNLLFMLMLLLSVSVFGQSTDTILVKKDSVVIKKPTYKLKTKVVPEHYTDMFTGEEMILYWIHWEIVWDRKRKGK